MPLLARMICARCPSTSGRARSPGSRRCSPTGGSPPAATSRWSSGPAWASRSPTTLRPRWPTPTSSRSARAASTPPASSPGELRAGDYDAVVGIGGGRTLDVAKYAATLGGLPMVAVATNLAHDGIASPVASLDEGGRKGSFGVQMPIAVVVDLDYVRRVGAARCGRSGIGDVVSNLSAIADWQLAARERGEPVDGLAVTFARTAARRCCTAPTASTTTTSSPRWPRRWCSRAWRWRPPAPAARAAAATTRSSTPSTSSSPGTARHGELAGAARLFCAFLRGDAAMAADIDACLRRHGLPRTPGRLGLTAEQFAEAVVLRAARPGRTATRSSSTWVSASRRCASACASSPRPSVAEAARGRAARIDLRAQQRRALGRAALHAQLLECG